MRTTFFNEKLYPWLKKGMVLVVFVVCLMISSMAIAQAATVTGTANSNRSFTVKTNNKLSRRITFTQNKGVAKGTTLSGKTKYYQLYGRYDIKVQYTYKGKSYTKKYTWTDKSKTFSLSKNTSYTITVLPHSNLTLHTSFKSIVKGFGFYGWYSAPSWKVTGNSGASVSTSSGTNTTVNNKVITSPYIRLSSGTSGGRTVKLYAQTSPSRTVSWKSSNSNVATVSSSGVVTACSSGSCTITASMNYNGKTYSAKKKISVSGGSSYGSWSDWSINYPSVGSNYQVESTKLYRYYCFYCPVCGGREPFQGLSDCHRYSLSLHNAQEKWFPVAYSACYPKRYSYTNRKYYTNSLGDGKRWNFSAGNLYSTAVGTRDSDSAATVIRTGYRYRRVYSNNCYIRSVS